MNHIVSYVHSVISTDSARAASRPFVGPIRFLATLIASLPAHAIQTTGPEVTNLINPGKKGL